MNTYRNPLQVVTLCSGIDFQCQALDRLVRKYPPFSYDLIGWSEIDKYAIQIHNILYPQWKNRNLGDMTKIDWTKFDGEIDLLTYSTPCFVAGTLVLTRDGYKPIEDVKVGDYVLTHNNRWCKVEKIGNKTASDIYDIKPMMGDHIYCTGNHPFLTREMYRYGHLCKRYFREPKWVEAKYLTKNLYLGYAINQEEKLPEWNGSNADRWGNRVNHLTPLFTKQAFWYLMGRYVGDGWKRIGKNGNSFIICCSNRNENTLINALDDCGFHYRRVIERTVYKYFVSMNELVSFVERYGYYAYGKHIDDETLNLPTDLLKAFLNGCVDSDGCYTNNEWKITSVSKELLTGITQCVAKVYHTHVKYSVFKRPKTCNIEGRIVNQRDTYTISWHVGHRKQDKAFYEDGVIWFPLSKPIEKIEGNRMVYNLQVAEDHSYTANGAIVHNCQDLSLAGRQDGMAEGSGTRSSLLWNVRDAVITKHPKFLILENVKNMVGKKFKPYFDKWLAELESYGYKNFWKVINAADCGVPQSRERVFCVSILRTQDDPDPQFYFPKPIPLTECMADRLDPKGTVPDKYWLSEKAVQYYERVDADKTHNHNFTRKKKRT